MSKSLARNGEPLREEDLCLDVTVRINLFRRTRKRNPILNGTQNPLPRHVSGLPGKYIAACSVHFGNFKQTGRTKRPACIIWQEHICCTGDSALRDDPCSFVHMNLIIDLKLSGNTFANRHRAVHAASVTFAS